MNQKNIWFVEFHDPNAIDGLRRRGIGLINCRSILAGSKPMGISMRCDPPCVSDAASKSQEADTGRAQTA